MALTQIFLPTEVFWNFFNHYPSWVNLPEVFHSTLQSFNNTNIKMSAPKNSICSASLVKPRGKIADTNNFKPHKSLPSLWQYLTGGDPGTFKCGKLCKKEGLLSPTGISTKPRFELISSSAKYFLTKVSLRFVSFPLFIRPIDFSFKKVFTFEGVHCHCPLLKHVALQNSLALWRISWVY